MKFISVLLFVVFVTHAHSDVFNVDVHVGDVWELKQSDPFKRESETTLRMKVLKIALDDGVYYVKWRVVGIPYEDSCDLDSFVAISKKVCGKVWGK